MMIIPTSSSRLARQWPLKRWIAVWPVCGSGVGGSVCANKIHGVRACLIEDHFSAKQGVEDDNSTSSVWAGASKARNWRGFGPSFSRR
jgi:hypothetical protein